MNPMLQAFVIESRDLLEAASQCLLKLEKDPGDKSLFDDLFRSVHTVKGASSIFDDLMPLTRVVHAAEDLLDLVKEGDVILSPENIDLLLDCLDQVNQWLEDIESREALPNEATQLSDGLAKQLRAIIGLDQDTPAPATSDNREQQEEAFAPLPDWFETVPHSIRLALLNRLVEDRDDLALPVSFVTAEYTPDEGCFFSGQDPITEVTQVEQLHWFRFVPHQAWPEEKTAFDPYKCNLRFELVTSLTTEAVLKHFYYVPEYVIARKHRIEDLIHVSGAQGDPSQFTPFIEEAQLLATNKDYEGLKQLASTAVEICSPALYQTNAFEWLHAILGSDIANEALINALLGAVKGQPFNYCVTDTSEQKTELVSDSASPSRDEGQSVPSAPTEPVEESKDHSLVIDLITMQLQSFNGAFDATQGAGKLRGTAETVRRICANSGIDIDQDALASATHEAIENQHPETLKECIHRIIESIAAPVQTEVANKAESDLSPEKPTTPPVSEPVAGPQTEKRATSNKTLKVDQSRIDDMMDLVGELVVAKNALPFLAKRAEEVYNLRELAKEIKSHYAIINRLADNMQSAVMAVRMIPMSSVFQRFPRLVRDLSRKLDKSIEIQLIGEETEADKTVVEDIADPLIHLVRNSIDHGIESKAVRQANNKPATATIKLIAEQFDDQVLIKIIDDGKGIDPTVIKQKALEKGVIDEDRFQSINDKDALQLIFEPGFSTAEQVTDLSGRGVGMDVVRTTIINAGGSVNVDSTVGEGTTITLALPLSMAVTQVMMIQCANQSYGVSFDMITETVRVARDTITTIKQQQTLVLRGRIIPLFDLRAVFGLPQASAHKEELAVLVVTIDGEEVGVLIDDFEGSIDVILKPLEGIMANYVQFSGSALLGDGRVLMVLNLRELLLCQ